MFNILSIMYMYKFQFFFHILLKTWFKIKCELQVLTLRFSNQDNMSIELSFMCFRNEMRVF